MAGQRDEPLRDDAVADAVRDREPLGAAGGLRDELADVARVVERRRHAREPLLPAFGAGGHRGEAEREGDGRPGTHGSGWLAGSSAPSIAASSSLMRPAPTLRRTSGDA